VFSVSRELKLRPLAFFKSNIFRSIPRELRVFELPVFDLRAIKNKPFLGPV
jgi:hypothetical protein